MWQRIQEYEHSQVPHGGMPRDPSVHLAYQVCHCCEHCCDPVMGWGLELHWTWSISCVEMLVILYSRIAR